MTSYTLGRCGYGDSRGNSHGHGYGYGVSMGIMINPFGLMEDTGFSRSTSVDMRIL